MMPLSRRVRNIWEEPFFNDGVTSFTLLISSSVSVRLLSRAILFKKLKLEEFNEQIDLKSASHLRLASCSTTESRKSCGYLHK